MIKEALDSNISFIKLSNNLFGDYDEAGLKLKIKRFKQKRAIKLK